MAKKIRFPLKMKNGAEVRTLDELKENFNLESVLGYFTDGRLATWLSDRYYDEKAVAVSALLADTPDLNAKLCEILEVEYQTEDDNTDMELIARRREKLRILSNITDDKEILDNVDLVAMDQDELLEIHNKRPEKIYLFRGEFQIELNYTNVMYIGIDGAQAKIIASDNVNFKDKKIIFKNLQISWDTTEITPNDSIFKAEKLISHGQINEAIDKLKPFAESCHPKAMLLLAKIFLYDEIL